MIKFPDVQGTRPGIPLSIRRVGVRGVVYPINIDRGDRRKNLYTNIDVFVDVPSTRKGADLSRTIESIDEVAGKSEEKGVEFLAEDIAQNALRKFPYSSRSEVHVEADYFASRSAEDGKKHVVKYRIISDSVATREDSTTSIGVVVKGINACPCAMETTRAMMADEYRLDSSLESMPTITHNQRNTVTLRIQTDRENQLEVDDLIDLAEKPVNGPLVSILKRRDEGELVYRAHKHPRFVEDIVREIASGLSSKYEKFPENFKVSIVSESDESIHPHNAFAQIESTFGELRKSLTGRP